MDVVARWPGSSHDSTIFTNSNLCNRLRRGDFGNDSALVVDSAYQPEHFICKPLAQTNTESQERYQRLQIRARNVAERVNGQLKRRFPILKYGAYLVYFEGYLCTAIQCSYFNLGMRFSRKEIAQDVVVCCCILHNMRKNFDAQAKTYSNIEYLRQIEISEDLQTLPQLSIQDYLIQHFFN